MQVWKRTYTSDGKPTLEAVLPEHLKGDKPIIFVFPGKDNVGNFENITDHNRKTLSGFFKLTEIYLVAKSCVKMLIW